VYGGIALGSVLSSWANLKIDSVHLHLDETNIDNQSSSVRHLAALTVCILRSVDYWCSRFVMQ
jgi:hypothetical protein